MQITSFNPSPDGDGMGWGDLPNSSSSYTPIDGESLPRD